MSIFRTHRDPSGSGAGRRGARGPAGRLTTRFIAVSVVLFLVAAACSGSQEGGEEPEAVQGPTLTGAASGEPIVIAALVGPVAEGGPDFLNGMEVAVDQINGAGGVDGRPIELRVFDTGGTAAGGLAAYKQAADDDEVVGAFFGAVSGALALRAQTDIVGLPIVIATANDEVDRPVARYVFKDSFATEYATSSLRYAVEQFGARRIAAIHYGTDYSVIIPGALEDRCDQLGCELVAVESAAADAPVDALTAQLTKMRAADPDVYYIEGLNPNAFAAARQLGIEEPIISEQWLAIPALRDACGQNCEGVVFAIHKTNVLELLDPEDPLREVFTTYRSDYESLFGDWAGFSIYGYDAVLAFAKGAEKLIAAGEQVTRDNLVEAMERFDGDLVTTHGIISTSPSNHRLVGTWDQSYIDVVIEIVDGTPTWTLAPGASTKGSTP